MHRHCNSVEPHPQELEGLSWAEIALFGIGNKPEEVRVCKDLRCMFRTLLATVSQDNPIVQVTVKADAHLPREGCQLLDQFGEDQGSQGKAEWEGLELEDLIFPNDTQSLPVSAVDQNVEIGFFEVDGGGPVAWSDSGSDGQWCLHLEPDMLQKAI